MDLTNLKKTAEQKEMEKLIDEIITLLTEKQLKVTEAMQVPMILQKKLQDIAGKFLNDKYLNHIINENPGK